MWPEYHPRSLTYTYLLTVSATFSMDEIMLFYPHFTGEEAGARYLDNLLQVTHREQVWSLDFHPDSLAPKFEPSTTTFILRIY